MNWLLAFLILIGLAIAAHKILNNNKLLLRQRLLGVFFLSIPVLAYVWDYQKVYYEHAQDCKAEYGLKILIEPEKTDAIQIFSDIGDAPAEGALKQFYPRLRYVEIADKKKYGKPQTYSSFSVTSTTDDRRKRGWTFDKTPINKLSEGVFRISKTSEYDKKIYRHKDVWLLTKNDQVYAKYTDLRRIWPKIRYPDSVPSFHCSDLGYESSVIPRYDLIELILK